ncbi:hypothetical protein ACFSKN_13265 [Mariniflexile gromovii]|uniref:Uncharacterized protein n=1 Tax=Mariniflexile gromovii TaxID=362523 RepID=A0ABS4BW69_9FLAO|nr:hypothetical protein [Mariniflexile gromovii]MBP0904833.1 hypothetical protein [Mariniflexile gromovii]
MKENSRKIVLGHPFSGALYAYFDKELNNGNYLEASKYHGYYKTLYRKQYESFIEISIAFSLLFDDIIIPAADNPVPDYQKYQTNGDYYNPDFGLFFTWRDDANYAHIVSEKIDFALNDLIIKQKLMKIPKPAHNQILHEVYYEISMAKRFDCPILTSGLRQELAKRISILESDNNPEFADLKKVTFVDYYLDITGLLFQPMNIDSFCYLKSENDLRKYADGFVNILETFEMKDNNSVKIELLKLIQEAINKDKLNSKISGAFSTSSSVLSYAGLIPVVGTVAGISSIVSDITSKGIDKLNVKNRWFELSSQIERIKSREKLKKALNKM